MESLSFSNLVVDKIAWSLPTKAAVQTCVYSNQWQDLAASLLTLDFDEDDDFQRHELLSEEHHKNLHDNFIKFLEGFLSFYVKHKKNESLEKLRIHTRMFSKDRQSFIITNWLEYALQGHRGLAELDICLDYYVKPYQTLIEHLVETEAPLKDKFYDGFYRLPLLLISSCGESLTTLKLGCVILQEFWYDQSPPLSFPSLKSLYLKAFRFRRQQSYGVLLRGCPSLEHLSLTHCSFDNSKLYVCCSTIKYLEVKYCNVDDIRVDQAINLESFSFVSARKIKCETLVLNSVFNLKHINVCAYKSIGVFSILGCHHALEASVKAKWISKFELLFDGYLSAKFSLIAPDSGNRRFVNYARILVGELLNRAELFSVDPTCTHRLVSFVRNFTGSCNMLSLYTEFETCRALIVPGVNAKESLDKISWLELKIPNWQRQFEQTVELAELNKTLHSMEPSANIKFDTVSVVVEEDRREVDQRARPANDRGG